MNKYRCSRCNYIGVEIACGNCGNLNTSKEIIGNTDDDLVTGTPVTPKKLYKISDKLSLFFEYAKLVQRIVMVILTVILLLIMYSTSMEIRDLKNEMQKISVLTERAMDIAETTRQDINRQVEEIQRDGIKLHFRLW